MVPIHDPGHYLVFLDMERDRAYLRPQMAKKKPTLPPWLAGCSVSPHDQITSFLTRMSAHWLARGRTMFHGSAYGKSAGIDADELLRLVRLATACPTPHAVWRRKDAGTWIWPESILTAEGIGSDSDGGVRLSIDSTDSVFAAAITAEVFPKAIKPDGDGCLFTLIEEDDALHFVEIDLIDQPLEHANYAADVLAAYDHILSDIRRPKPCGRLVVLQGPPGSGKTFLVRGLVTETKGAVFALVPASLVSRLGEPKFLTALLNARRKGKNKPMVVVVEDADSVLRDRNEDRRDKDTLDAVSALLNLSDGLVGAALNIRVVLTTNIKAISIDPAAMRAGRLCRHVHVGPLPEEKARPLYNRLVAQHMAIPAALLNEPMPGGTRAEADGHLLADIYRMATDHAEHAEQQSVRPQPPAQPAPPPSVAS